MCLDSNTCQLCGLGHFNSSFLSLVLPFYQLKNIKTLCDSCICMTYTGIL